MTRVLIVDDHPVVRQGMAALLATAPGVVVVGAAATVDEALHAAHDLTPDVVLTDLRLGVGEQDTVTRDGVWLCEQLRPGGTDGDGPAVVILTTYDHDRDIVRAVEAGAAGYLLKDADPETIIRAVTDAAAGLDVLPDDLAQRVVDTMRAPRVELSSRERQVLAQVAVGASNRDIARTLFITEATVKTHLVRAFAKLGVDSRTAAANRARELGLLD
ncbi:response regulator [Propionibacteriaceae bacterium G1746]